MNESDPRSDVHYLGSSENKAWKKFQACTGFEERKIKKGFLLGNFNEANFCVLNLTCYGYCDQFWDWWI